jgi:hypothetical protein
VDNQANIPEWFAPVVNLVGKVGTLAKKHDSGMRSFDVQCTSYNPEINGNRKLNEFTLRCFFDTGKRWEAYEPPHSGVLVHIVGQLIGKYKEGNDEKPAVLITDFKVLPLSRNKRTMASGGTSASSPEISTPNKWRYGPKSSKMVTSLVTPEGSVPVAATTPDKLDLGDADSSYTEVSPTGIRGVAKLSASLLENVESLSEPSEIQSNMMESEQRRPKRTKRGQRGNKYGSLNM